MSSVDFSVGKEKRQVHGARAGQRVDRSLRGRGAVTLQSGLPLHWVEGGPMIVQSSALRRRRLAIKRLVDVTLSCLGLLALGPLLLLVAIAIKVSGPGPVLFRQARQGMHGKAFRAFKFRSMRIEDCDESGVNQTAPADPRITPIGRFLRQTSIDELPQLLNVLRGEMSLVGPRPHVEGMHAGGMVYADLVSYYDRRLDMLPGITGWAQANGLRGSTTDPERARARIDHDLAYIQNFSLGLDMTILAVTVWREFLGGSGD